MLISIKDNIVKYKKVLKKPYWIKVKLKTNSQYIKNTRTMIHKNKLNSICEQASCPNLVKCFDRGTVAFMILGELCTRKCPFCNVKYGRPTSPNINEPEKLAETIHKMKLRHVVITSVNRDDLYDGGAKHFSNCIIAIRNKNPSICIEILVPDFRRNMNIALNIINITPPDIFNHNLESVPRIYHKIRPGASYQHSLKLLYYFKKFNPKLLTKSGLMMGLGETNEEIIDVMYDLRHHGVNMFTLGQYLQPSKHHLPVKRYVNPHEFEIMKKKAISIGFTHVACGPLIRSSYYADLQVNNINFK